MVLLQAYYSDSSLFFFFKILFRLIVFVEPYKPIQNEKHGSVCGRSVYSLSNYNKQF